MRAPVLVIAVTLAVLLSGCSASVEPSDTDATPSATPIVTSTPTPTASAPAESAPQVGPVDVFLEWLAASREPDAARACSLMSAELQQRMLDEFAVTLGASFPDCHAMITETAAIYAAVGASADVDVEVVTETANEATLFATYGDSGKCGTIHLAASGDSWILTEQSEVCTR